MISCNRKSNDKYNNANAIVDQRISDDEGFTTCINNTLCSVNNILLYLRKGDAIFGISVLDLIRDIFHEVWSKYHCHDMENASNIRLTMSPRWSPQSNQAEVGLNRIKTLDRI